MYVVYFCIIFCLFIELKGRSIVVSSSPQVFQDRNEFYRGLIVVPGLGRTDRLLTILHNVEMLGLQPLADRRYNHSNQWDCIVYIYANRSNTEFWSNRAALSRLARYCDLMEHPDRKVTENLRLLQPALIRSLYQYVFLLLDDCRILPRRPFVLHEAVRLLRCNNLTVLSPLITGANRGGGQKFRNIMQISAPLDTAGYVSSFVEIFAWLMTMPAYSALWDLLCPWINPYAWGYDFWYNGYASDHVKGHKMGIINTYSLLHDQDGEATAAKNRGLGRTDDTKIEVKWNAVLAQERYYRQYLNTPLHLYRKHFDIANVSWNGAVKGYLKHCS